MARAPTRASCRVRAVEDPPGQVDDRRERRPRSRTCGRSGGRSRSARAARARPRARRRASFQNQVASKPKSLSQSSAGRRRDHDQLEDRPAEALQRRSARSRGTSRGGRAARAGAPSPARARRRRSAPRARASSCRSAPPTSVASSACFSERSKYAGRTRTSSEMPRFVQSSSRVDAARARAAAPARARFPTAALLSPTTSLPSLVRTGSGSTGVISAWTCRAPRWRAV